VQAVAGAPTALPVPAAAGIAVLSGQVMNWKLRIVFAVLIGLFVILQYRLWVGEGSLAEVRELRRLLADQQQELQALRQKNHELRAEVESLKHDDSAIEARARSELGMIGEHETYFQLIRPQDDTDD
jgi:cell division protein FtsB